ncbi:MAG: threonine-phosphate decarboxylase [Geminicoccaceae bacterium]|nr:threonine-phosphate decarboxylase [Geminicoccaceae bacterium]
MSSVIHGGDLAGAGLRFGEPAGGWIDLSTGINPYAYPVGALGASVWSRLPHPQELEAAARSAYGVPEGAEIVAAAGTSAIIRQLPRLFACGRVGILGPTYAEHARAFAAEGHAVFHVSSLEQAGGIDLLVVVNPNNPDGRRIAPEALAACPATTIIDESFVDATPELSCVDQAESPKRVVLRSFGKFFGLAGLRLGFAVLAAGPASRLRALLGPWPASGPAIEIGTRALGDRRWIEATRVRLARDARRLDELLTSSGLEVVGGTDLFRLVEIADAASLQAHLARSGIWTRIFDYSATWLRIGLPGDGEQWRRLERVIASRPEAPAPRSDP